MACTGPILAVSYSPTTSFHRGYGYRYSNSRLVSRKTKSNLKRRPLASDPEASSFPSPVDSESSDKSSAGFCIIEGPETVEDFARMQLQEIQDNIRGRRHKIFLQMEEVRRLRIQQRIKNAELGILKELGLRGYEMESMISRCDVESDFLRINK